MVIKTVVADKFVYIDEVDLNKVKDFSKESMILVPSGSQQGVAIRTKNENGKRKIHMVARIITDAPADKIIRFADHDSLNLTRANILVLDKSQKNMGRSKSTKRSYTSQYMGVSWSESSMKWRAYIMIQVKGVSKLKHLGYFEEEKKAAEAYDIAARKYYQELAKLNFSN